ncbi:MAG TPA: SDR family NAD(P)-dependent oxidoreductase [Ornithinibacter sp.]|nr:SDR family NAD(P)-dependent oxidoreductase [Ornithinibacter sp.]HPV90871.1 SDR family NAD(P)-dependent oxidoreductase [Ornithinibacter sp.]
MRVAGTHVLLTGATGDIGRRLATHLSDAAARLTLVARSTQPLEALAADLGAHAVPADLTDRDTLRSLIRDVEQAHGPVDVLVNNAGTETVGHLTHLSPDDLEHLLALNLLAPVELCRQVLPGMTARGRGHLVNISSLAGVATFPGLATYGATKAGLTHFTSGLRADLRGGPIGTLAVEIGPVSSQMMSRIASHPPTAAAFDRVLGLRALTMLDPDAVARAVVAAVEDDQATLRMPRRAAPLATLAHAPRSVVRLALTGIR